MTLRRSQLIAVAALALIAGWLGQFSAALAQDAAKAATRPPLSIPIFVSSRNDLCYDQGDLAAIKALTTKEALRINRQGGIAGRSIELRFLDDARDQPKSNAALGSALADPQTVAMIGMSNSNRAKIAFEANGPALRGSGIPFLSNIAVNSIFEGYANVFTTQASQDDERLPVMTRFIRHMKFERTAFVGMRDAVFSNTLGDGLKEQLGQGAVVGDYRLRTIGDGFDTAEIASTVAMLKDKNPDMLVLSIGAARSAVVMKQLMAAGVTPALFITGRIEALPTEVTSAWPNAIYQLAWDRLPEAYSDRLRKLIAREGQDNWNFEGSKVAEAPGWKSGECKPRPDNATPNPITADNLRAIGIGTQYADMVALIAAITRTADARTDIAGLRRHIASELKSTYAAGRGAFKGSFENWSFNPTSRSAMRTPFIVILPHGLGRTQLAPVQFVRVKDGSLRQIETLYVDVDLIKAHRIDDNEKSFFAEFYLTMRDTPTASIDQIEFTNAYLDPKTNGRQLSVQALHKGGASNSYPETMKVYKITGRFIFEPELASFPFDTQRFAIELQPKSGDAPFIVQPPPLQVRNQQLISDGWDRKSQYVGYEEDFVSVVDAFTHQPSVTPYYKASFVWLMKRQTTDYYLRVVVPLLFILIVAYLSIFIPQSHFEAIVTIQVTALLSAVALYISLPKLDSDTATVSDRIFVFDYMMVSLMIVISILRVNRRIAHRKWLQHILGFLHIVGVPMMLAAMSWYVTGLSVADR